MYSYNLDGSITSPAPSVPPLGKLCAARSTAWLRCCSRLRVTVDLREATVSQGCATALEDMLPLGLVGEGRRLSVRWGGVSPPLREVGEGRWPPPPRKVGEERHHSVRWGMAVAATQGGAGGALPPLREVGEGLRCCSERWKLAPPLGEGGGGGGLALLLGGRQGSAKWNPNKAIYLGSIQRNGSSI